MYQSILVPLDGSELAETVLPHLRTIAQGCQTKDVQILQVVLRPDIHMLAGELVDPEFAERIEAANRELAGKYLTQVTNRLIGEGIRARWTIITGVDIAGAIADYASENGVDLILMASHGRTGVTSWVWSETAERVLRASCVPVLMVRAPGCGPRVFNVSFSVDLD